MASTPGVKLTWKVDQDMINKTVEDLKKTSLQVYDTVGKLTADQITYDNVIKVGGNVAVICVDRQLNVYRWISTLCFKD